MLFEKPQYIKISDAIRIIERAADNGLINQRTAEIMIQDLYHETDPSKYHKPK